MEFIVFIIILVLLFLVLNLRTRVQKLEGLISINVNSELTEAKTSSITPEQKQTINSASQNLLVDYVKQQVNQGISKQEIVFALVNNGWQLPIIEETYNAIISSNKQPLSQPAVSSPIKKPATGLRFINWLKEDWLLKLGALLLLIGFGWLTTYAFLNNWIGPMGRIVLGILAGTLFLILGWWRTKKYIHQGGIFLVLGSTTILLTIFAAREIYNFFTPLSALTVMFLSTAFVALASIKYKNHHLALLSLILAGIAPLLTDSPSDNYIGLFSYLLIVVLGTIWIVIITGKRELTIAALLLITFYSLPHFLNLKNVDTSTLLIFSYLFATIFFLTNTIGIIKLKEKNLKPDLITAAGNGLFLLVWILTAANDEWKSLLISAWLIVFMVGAFILFKITHKREVFYVYAGVGVAMLAAATSAELKGATLTIAYTIEAGLITLIIYLLLRNISSAQKASLLLLFPIFLSLQSIGARSWTISILNKDFFVLLILGLTLLALGIFFYFINRQLEKNEIKKFSMIMMILGSIYFYILIWLTSHAGFNKQDFATTFSLILYTIIGLIFYFIGIKNNKNGFRLYGGSLLGFVVVRLLIIDVWSMALSGRIVTFFLVGILLISTAFFDKKRKKSVENKF